MAIESCFFVLSVLNIMGAQSSDKPVNIPEKWDHLDATKMSEVLTCKDPSIFNIIKIYLLESCMGGALKKAFHQNSSLPFSGVGKCPN